MVKQNINIVGIQTLYNILEEIKKNLAFQLINYNKEDEFLKFLNEKKIDIINLNKRAKELDACLVTTEKDYFRLNNEDKKNIKYLKFELLIDKKEEFINELKKII